jgi:hypothetical protein
MRTFVKWTENELQMAVAAFRYGDYGSNACSKLYGVLVITKKACREGKTGTRML